MYFNLLNWGCYRLVVIHQYYPRAKTYFIMQTCTINGIKIYSRCYFWGAWMALQIIFDSP